jgi:Transposase DDE domain
MMEMLSSSWFDRPFGHWLSRLRRQLDLDGLARGCGAILRSRKIGDGGELLRLALIYGPGGCSLRETAVRQSALGVMISDTAVTKRLAKAGQFLEAVLGQMLRAAVPQAPMPEGHRLVLVDATTINAPGSQGCDWRLHCRQSDGRLEGFELTSAQGGEKLSRFDFAPGDIVVADRGYRGVAGLAHVRAAGADVLLRVGWRTYGWRDQSGAAVSLTACFDHVGPGQMDEAALLVAGPDGTTQPVRVIAFGQSDTATDAARRKTRRKSTHHHHVVDPSSLAAARHLYLMTSLTGPDWPPARLVQMYRTRWQIELAFKRLKSILHIDRLNTRDPALARSWILAHLIAAVMLEEVAGVTPDTPTLGPSLHSHLRGANCAS